MYEHYAKARDAKGLSDATVSKQAGISQTTLSDWKKGKYTPKAEKLGKIADVLGVSISFLTTGKDTPKESIKGNVYYFDDATAEKAQQLFSNPDMRLLFDAAQDCKPEDLQMAANLLLRLKESNPDG